MLILQIKNAKFSGCCFYMSTNMWDFQISISVPLNDPSICQLCWQLNNIFYFIFTDRFHQDKFTTFRRLTRFQISTQLQLEFRYIVEKLNNTSLNYGRKIITAIQHTRSKFKQRVTSQLIFQFINNVALSIECGLFQFYINRLEIDLGLGNIQQS